MITEEEIKVAKDCFRGRVALSMDKPENVLGRALEDLTFKGSLETIEELLKATEAVSVEDVRGLARDLFKENLISVAVVGDYSELGF